MTGKRPDKKQGQTIDGKTGKPEPPPRRIDLSSLRDVRLELAAVYRKVDRGEIPSADGTRRAYILRQVADILVVADLEQRLNELEQRAGAPGAGGQPRPLN